LALAALSSTVLASEGPAHRHVLQKRAAPKLSVWPDRSAQVAG
jgi:hypothetical protein